MKFQLAVSILTVGIIFSAFVIICVRGCQPDAEVKGTDGEAVASSVCGIMYVASHETKRADFQYLLQQTRKNCPDDEPGKETSYRNEDGSLKHVVIIGDKDVIKTPGTPYDACIINWELDQVTAFKAFENVCLNRRF